jgi:hypothetical protein
MHIFVYISLSLFRVRNISDENCRENQNTHYKKKLRGLSPRAKYTDRAAAAGRRS